MPVIDEDGTTRLVFNVQGVMHTAGNSVSPQGYNFNPYLKVGNPRDLQEFQNFVHNNSEDNRFFVDKNSLQQHHKMLWGFYAWKSGFYHQTHASHRPDGNDPPIDVELWHQRMEILNEGFGDDDSYEFYVSDGIVGVGDTQAVLSAARIEPPDRIERFRFIQQFLLPGISVPSLIETDPNEFTMYFDVERSRVSALTPPTEVLQPEEFPNNWLWYGAPGTGKSHSLKARAKELIGGTEDDFATNFFPFSFSPATTYGDFIGEYKPVMAYNSGNQVDLVNINGEPMELPGDPVITYKFVPGEFTKALLQSMRYPDQKVVMLIDEINRGDIYEILGEVFQLMGRDVTGEGSYDMPLSPPAMNYINAELSEFLQPEVDYNQLPIRELRVLLDERGMDDIIRNRKAPIVEALQQYDIENPPANQVITKIKLQNNFYLWGTMNPNDSSVQQIDSAFFRRWTTKHISIDYDSGEYEREQRRLPAPLAGRWGDFRNKLNQLLIASERYDESDLIGKYFLKSRDLDNWDAFCSKLVFHLANNVMKGNLEGNNVFTANSVHEIMKICRIGEPDQSPFVRDHFETVQQDEE